IGEVVEGERHRVGPPAVERAEVIALRLDLQVEHAHLVSGLPRRRGDQLEPERLQPEVHLRVHETAGGNSGQPHRILLSLGSPSAGAATASPTTAPMNSSTRCHRWPSQYACDPSAATSNSAGSPARAGTSSAAKPPSSA